MSNLLTKLIIEPGTNVKLRGAGITCNRPVLCTMPLHKIEPVVKKVVQLPAPKRNSEFLVAPETKVKLGDIDPSYHGAYESREMAEPELASHVHKLDRLQHTMYAEGKHSLLIILQGLDASGKDAVRSADHSDRPSGKG